MNSYLWWTITVMNLWCAACIRTWCGPWWEKPFCYSLHKVVRPSLDRFPVSEGRQLWSIFSNYLDLWTKSPRLNLVKQSWSGRVGSDHLVPGQTIWSSRVQTRKQRGLLPLRAFKSPIRPHLFAAIITHSPYLWRTSTHTYVIHLEGELLYLPW